MDDAQLLRYSRHVLLDELGVEAQQRLLDATALIIGVGGLGSPAALYLAAAGLGHLILVDDDVVELSNLQRQILHGEEGLGQAKVESGRRNLHALNSGITIETHHRRIDGAWLDERMPDVSIVLDCSDNFATRQAVNRACVAHGIPLVSGSALRFDGQVIAFDTREASSPCYHCLYPDSQQIETLHCASAGVFAPLTGIVGTLQAADALKLVGRFGEAAVGRLTLVDSLHARFHQIQVPRDPSCPVCARRPGPPGGSQATAAAADFAD